MPTIERSSCPRCGAPPGSLSLGEGLRARPLGTFSLSGSTPKVSAYAVPVLRCASCGLEHEGEYDVDGRHVTFPPLPSGDDDEDDDDDDEEAT